MSKPYSFIKLFLPIVILCLLASIGNATELEHVVEVQKYNRAIHIMAMLLAGFGFLMVFVKKYGRSAVTATYLLVSVALPLYILKDSLGIMGGSGSEIDILILAEFAALFIVDGINKGSQLAGIGITVLVAIVTGFVAGKIIAVLGRRTAP